MSDSAFIEIETDVRKEHPRFYLVIVNIQKVANVRSMILAAFAFGCHEVLIVGQEKNRERLGLEDQIPVDSFLKTFPKWKDCRTFMKEKSIFLIGVEIDETSKPLNDEYFETHFPAHQNNVGILMGNEGQGILPCFIKDCSALIRIPQYGSGTASLNVNVAANIILYRFQQWKWRKRRTTPKQINSNIIE
jgi:tRNA G18 (ribose-2'-O)-methylase SpoU